MLLSELIKNNEEYFKKQKIKPIFSYCIRCAGADGCYCNGMGPNFLEPACYRGPMSFSEMESAKTDEWD